MSFIGRKPHYLRKTAIAINDQTNVVGPWAIFDLRPKQGFVNLVED
jgi:hypothetical protein